MLVVARAGPRLRGPAHRALVSCSVESSQFGPRDAGDLFGSPNQFGKKPAKAEPPAGLFYQRVLPAAQVPFASAEGRRLFREALQSGFMENYFYLAEQFRTQDEPTYCGLTTLAMALNSLRIDPMQTWKGVWRWYNESMLTCCAVPEEVREEGISFDMFRSLASCQGANVIAHRAPEQGASVGERAAFEEKFRAAVKSVTQSQEREVLVICYSRATLGQTGAGHFSPIGGFHPEKDAVLILDVARFKYPPHWAPLSKVVEGMCEEDPDVGLTRGFLHLQLQLAESESVSLNPLYVPFVPAAAGRKLSHSLADALASQCPAAGLESGHLVAMRRWLQAASVTEPNVLRELLRVGDAAALREVVSRLNLLPVFKELCECYEFLVAVHRSGHPFNSQFPPLLLGDASADLSEASLGTCGELWVLLLLLLPEHLRAAVSPVVVGPEVTKGVPHAVRGPWALPLEALREMLHQLLPAPDGQRFCASLASVTAGPFAESVK